MKRTTRQWAVLGVVVVVVCVAGYLAAANLLLRSGWLLRLINRHPDRFALHYASAWTVLPGVVHLERIELTGQARTSQWWAGIDRATIDIDLPRLLGRQLVASSLDAGGVAFRLRRRPEGPEGPESTEAAAAGPRAVAPASPGGAAAAGGGAGSGRQDPRRDLQWHPVGAPPATPVIPGLVNTPAPPPPAAEAAAQQDGWRIRLAGVTLHQVREVWIAGYRFAGQARVRGGFDLDLGRRLALDSEVAVVQRGALQVAERPLLDGVTGTVRFQLPPFDPGHLEGGFLPLASGELKLQGQMQSLGFLAPYMTHVPWITLGGDAGTFQAALAVRRGVYLPGAHIAARPGSVTAKLLDDVAEGRCQVTWDVAADRGGPVGRLVAAFEAFRLGRAGAGEAQAEGHGLRIEIATRDLHVAAVPAPAAVAIDLPPTAVGDFASYNRNLPRRAGIRLAGGSGVISANLRAAAPAWEATGGIDLSGKGVEVVLPGTRLRGDLHAQSRFRALLRQRQLLLTASDVVVSGVQRLDGGAAVEGSRRAGGAQEPGWWARAHLDYLALERSGDTVLQARLHGTLSDTRPLMAMLAPRPKPLLGWLDRLLDLHPIDATGNLAMGSGSIRIDGLTMTSGKASIRADLRFAGGQDDGILYAAYGPLGVGMQLRGGHRTWKLVGARRWFEAQPQAGTDAGHGPPPDSRPWRQGPGKR